MKPFHLTAGCSGCRNHAPPDHEVLFLQTVDDAFSFPRSPGKKTDLSSRQKVLMDAQAQ